MSESVIRGAAAEKRHEVTTQLGMWAFLATEVLFFGGLFTAYGLFRHAYPQAFAAGGHHMQLALGTINTALLLISSVFMAIADRAVRAGERRMALACLAATWLLGAGFLGIKAVEYATHAADHLVPGAHFEPGRPADPPLQLFMFLYFAMTGLHAAHMLLGLSAVGWLMLKIWRRQVGAGRPEPAAVIGLYWHFVDCIWVFLYPLFYLVGR